jgi:hypothetical protein
MNRYESYLAVDYAVKTFMTASNSEPEISQVPVAAYPEKTRK